MATDGTQRKSLSVLLRRAQQAAEDIFQRTYSRTDFTLRQTALLAAIADNEGSSQIELVRSTGIDRSTLSEMVTRMERRGYLERSESAFDGRAKTVKLTRLGHAQLQAALPAMRRVDRSLMAALPENERAIFKQLLAALPQAAA